MSDNVEHSLKSQGIFNRLSFLAKDTAIYGLANAFSKLFSVFLIPILTSLLSKEEFGVVDGINMLMALFLPIIIFGQDSALARFYFELKGTSERANLASQSLLLQGLLAILTILIINIASGSIGKHYFGNSQHVDIIKIASISLFFSFVLRYCSNLLKWQFRRIPFVILSVGMPVFSTALTILSLKFTDFGVIGVFYSQLVAFAVFAAIAMIFVFKSLRFPRDFRWIPNLISFGWPYFIIMILPVILPSFDRYLIINNFDLNSLGLYALAFRIASIIQLPIYGFQTAWAPFAYSIYNTPKYQETYSFTLKCYVSILIVVGIFINIFLKEIITIFSNNTYLSATLLIIPILLGNIVESISWVTGIGIDISKKSYLSAICYGVSITIGLCLSWVGIKYFGLEGLVIFGLISKILFTSLKSLFANMSLRIAFDYIPLIVFLAFAVIFGISYQYVMIEVESIAVRFVSALFLLGMTAIVNWFVLFRNQERLKIKEVVQVVFKKYVRNNRYH